MISWVLPAPELLVPLALPIQRSSWIEHTSDFYPPNISKAINHGLMVCTRMRKKESGKLLFEVPFALSKTFLQCLRVYTYVLLQKGKRTDLKASKAEKAVLSSEWGVKACWAFTHCQSRARSRDLFRSRDRKQNESGRNTCLVKFIERLCACHRASIIYLLLDIIKSWQRQVMTQEAQTNRESLWKSKENNCSPFQV